MNEILEFTNDLSVVLQKRDWDLLNPLSLANATKQELQEMRMMGGRNLYPRFIRFVISMILTCLIWMHHMCKGRNLTDVL